MAKELGQEVIGQNGLPTLASVRNRNNVTPEGTVTDPPDDDKPRLRNRNRGGGSSRFTRTDQTIRDVDNLSDLPFAYRQGADNIRLRAEDQPWTEQAVRTGAKLVPNILLGLGETAGYLLDLNAHWDTITGEGNDYSNFVTELAQRGKEGLNDALPVYRLNPNETFDLGDFAWWMQNGAGLVESVAQFAAVGAGLGSVLARGAAAVSRTAAASRVLSLGAQTLTAGSLAYVEGAMEGADVYRSTFTLARERGLDDQAAQRLAGEAAAHTVRLNTVANTALNFLSVAPAFRSMSAHKSLVRSGLGRGVAEDTAAYAARLGSISAPAHGVGATLGRIGLESAQESAEEVVNQIASSEGRARAGRTLGTDSRDLSARLSDVFRDEETWLAATLGAVGGAVQTGIMEHAPIHRTPTGTNEAGEVTYERRSAAQTEAANDVALFEQRRQTLMNRLDAFQKAQEKLKVSLEADDRVGYQQAQNELFGLTAYNSIVLGTEQQLLQSYEEIENLTPEQALELGYISSIDAEPEYKQLAQEKKQEIRQLRKDYEDIQAKYGFRGDERLADLPDFVFRAHLARHNTGRQLEKVVKERARIEAEIRERQRLLGTDMSVTEHNLLVEEIAALNDSIERQQEDIDRLTDDWHNVDTRNELREKYMLPKMRNRNQTAMKVEELSEAFYEVRHNVAKKIQDQKEAFTTRAKEADPSLTQEQINKKWEKFLNLNEQDKSDIRTAIGMETRLRRDLQFFEDAYSEITSQKGRDNYINTKLEIEQEAEKRTDDELIRRINEAVNVTEIDKIVPEGTEVREPVKEAAAKKKAEIKRKVVKEEKAKKSEIDRRAEEVVATPRETSSPMGAKTSPTSPTQREEAGETGTPPESLPGTLQTEEKPVTNATSDRKEMTPEKVETFIEAIRTETSLDELYSLYEFIEDGYRVPKEVSEAFLAQKDLLRENRRTADEQATAAEENAETVPETAPRNVVSSPEAIASIVKEDTTTTRGDGRVIERTPDKTSRIALSDDKVVEAAISMAYLSREYYETDTGIKVTKEGMREDYRVPFAEHPSIGVGTPVRIELAKDYRTEEESWDSIVALHGADAALYVPIRIVATIDGEEQTVGYVHTADWIDALDSRNRPKNVAELDGDNHERQKELIRKLRERLWDLESVETTIQSKSLGKLSVMYEYDSEGKIKTRGGDAVHRFEVMRETFYTRDVEFYVIREESYQSRRGRTTDKTLANSRDISSGDYNGEVGLILPTPVEGVSLAVPVWIPTLSDTQVEVAFRAVEAYERNQDFAEATDLGFQFGKKNPDSLSRVLRSFFYSTPFSENTFENRDENPDRIYTYVSDKNGTFSIGRHGDAVIYTTDRNKIKAGAKDALKHPEEVKALLRQVLMNVDIDGINRNNKFRVPVMGEEGITVRTYKSYNEYLKDHLKTDIDGTGSVLGDPVYFQQPVVQIDPRPILNTTRKNIGIDTEGLPQTAEEAEAETVTPTPRETSNPMGKKPKAPVATEEAGPEVSEILAAFDALPASLKGVSPRTRKIVSEATGSYVRIVHYDKDRASSKTTFSPDKAGMGSPQAVFAIDDPKGVYILGVRENDVPFGTENGRLVSGVTKDGELYSVETSRAETGTDVAADEDDLTSLFDTEGDDFKDPFADADYGTPVLAEKSYSPSTLPSEFLTSAEEEMEQSDTLRISCKL